MLGRLPHGTCLTQYCLSEYNIWLCGSVHNLQCLEHITLWYSSGSKPPWLPSHAHKSMRKAWWKLIMDLNIAQVPRRGGGWEGTWRKLYKASFHYAFIMTCLAVVVTSEQDVKVTLNSSASDCCSIIQPDDSMVSQSNFLLTSSQVPLVPQRFNPSNCL